MDRGSYSVHDEIKKNGRGLEKFRLQYVLRKMIECIGHVHARGICHGDIKPENFLYFEFDNLRLIDFDHCVQFGEPLQSGTAMYVPPELAAFNLHPDTVLPPHASEAMDVWMLCMSAMELFLGYHPLGTISDSKEMWNVIVHGFEFPGPVQEDTDAMSFFKRGLALDPRNRWTLSGLLGHSFVAGGIRPTEVLIRASDEKMKFEIASRLEELMSKMDEHGRQMLKSLGMQVKSAYALRQLDDLSTRIKGMEELMVDQKKALESLDSAFERQDVGCLKNMLAKLETLDPEAMKSEIMNRLDRVEDTFKNSFDENSSEIMKGVASLRDRCYRKDIIVSAIYEELDPKRKQFLATTIKEDTSHQGGGVVHCRKGFKRRIRLEIFCDLNAEFVVEGCSNVRLSHWRKMSQKKGTSDIIAGAIDMQIADQHGFEEVMNKYEVVLEFPENEIVGEWENVMLKECKKGERVLCTLHLVLMIRDLVSGEVRPLPFLNEGIAFKVKKDSMNVFEQNGVFQRLKESWAKCPSWASIACRGLLLILVVAL
eukprot:TRINITY_DN9348_c0_g1_i1.p1 TRINITY_DN9348_c0_g1~~TRINITY_DN9348_c0_g1_i1.p1  ORF type:complete len:629 (+),score=174.56 TRINITY_DN9348_c0_g1_i1:273-1889(+)